MESLQHFIGYWVGDTPDHAEGARWGRGTIVSAQVATKGLAIGVKLSEKESA